MNLSLHEVFMIDGIRQHIIVPLGNKKPTLPYWLRMC